MKIETKRLLLYPISDGEMRELIENETDAELKQAYSEMLDGCVKDPQNRIWYAAWFIELKQSAGTVVGDLCFKGIGDDGAVELGYGLKDGYCGNGYMTEAVTAVSNWALEQNGIIRVDAETAPDNTASQNVLIRAGFSKNGEIGEEGPRFSRYKEKGEK